MKRLAILALLLAACGDDGGHHQGEQDAAIDGAPGQQDAAADAFVPPQPVTIEVTSGGSAVGSAQIYFLNADDSVVLSTTTDATGGSASAMMTAGGSVTAAVVTAAPSLAGRPIFAIGRTDVYTFEGVEPGDHLHVDINPQPANQAVEVTLPLDGTASSYQLFASCSTASPQSGTDLTIGSGVATGTVALAPGCTTSDFAVWSMGSGFTHVATAANIPITATLNLGTNLSAYAAPASEIVTLTDATANTSTDVEQFLVTANGTLGSPEQARIATATSSGSGTLDDASLGSARMLTIVEPDIASGAWGEVDSAELAAGSSTYSLDVNATMLHVFATEPAFDTPSHTLSWTEGATGIAPELAVADLEWSIGSGVGERVVLWHVAAPRTGTSIVFPVLPATPIDYNPTAADSVMLDDLDELSLPGGYDAFRAHAFAELDPSQVISVNGLVAHESAVSSPSLRRGHRASVRPSVRAIR